MEQMGRLIRVRNVKPLKGFNVHIEFEDGIQKKVDLEKYLHGQIFEPIRQNPEMFRSLKVEDGVICWDNGADIDPDVLYYNLKPSWMDLEETPQRS